MSSAPAPPTNPIGSRMYTTSERSAAERSASFVSRAVSLYSGAKVAQTSTPQADQHISHNHTSESWSPPQDGSVALMVLSRFALSKLPLRNGRIIITKKRHTREAPSE